MSPGALPDRWAGGDRYESFIGRWSRVVAPTFLTGLDVPDGAWWLDVGCGTGALTSAILDLRAPAGVVGVDPSVDLLAHADATVQEHRVEFREGDARHLPVGDGSSDAVVSGLVLNFVPDTAAALREMVRAVRPGGVVAAYVWDYAEGMELLRYFWDAAVALDPAAAALDEGARFPLCRPAPLADAFDGVGLVHVAVEPIVVPTAFSGVDELWAPFLGGTGPAPAYLASLPGEQVAALRAELVARLPVAPDGAVRLSARAWAVSGGVRHVDS